MFTELSNILCLDDASAIADKSLLVLESATDASLVLHHFLSYFLRNENNVCFLGLSQTFNHYNSVGTKLGTPLTVHKDSGSLVFIEGLKEIGNLLGNSCDDFETTESVQEDIGRSQTFDCSANFLKSLYQRIVQTIKNWQDNKPFLLIVDDLTVLIDLGFETKDILMFMTYLKGLVRNAGDSTNGTLVSLVKTQLDSEDEQTDVVARQLIHSADTVLYCSALQSGYCKDVHGQVQKYIG